MLTKGATDAQSRECESGELHFDGSDEKILISQK
jgi:hypothetical protein